MKPKILPVIICLAFILFKVFPSFGQSSWTGATSTVWNLASNWSTNVIPTAATDVIIGDRSLTLQPTIGATANCKSLTIGGTNTGTLTVNANLTVVNDITINSNGTLTHGLVTLTLGGNWNNGGTYTGASTSTGSTVTFKGAAAQSLGGTAITTFYKLIKDSSGTVTLTSNITLNSSASAGGNINVKSGTFDLSTFLANRGTTVPGGTLKVFDGAFLKIGGTNSFPSNYNTYTLQGASTVEYNGANQPISAQFYGNLVLSSSGGDVVKTMPATDFTVFGSLTSTIGLGASVSYAAASNITVNGSVNIGPSTTFDGATFSHSITGVWNNNNGTFIPGTSTIILNGGGTGISGNSDQNFYNLTVAGSVDLLGSGTIAVRNLIINPIGSLIVDNATLQIAGTIASSGNFDASVGIIEMNGADSQTIPVNTFLNKAVDQLIISNSSLGGVILGGAVDVYGSLTYSAAGLKLTTNDSLTLKSNVSNTAWIGDMTGKTIIGKVTVERYIPAHKAWQFLSIPTNTTQTVQQTWQEGATGTSSDPVPGYGTQITSNQSTWSADGFDLQSIAPSMKRYNSATNTWIGINTTDADSIKAPDGYMVFVRGDRTANTFTSTSTETVLRTKGSLYTGNQDTIFVSANKFVSIGNPYASEVDMRFITKSGLKDFFYVWDPQLGGSKGLGSYQTFSNNGEGDYIIIPGDGSYGGSGSVSDYMFSGQAFLIQADSAGGYLTFNEGAKTSVISSSGIVSGLSRPQLRASLYGVNADNSNYMIDGTLINYDDSYSNSVDNMDAIKSINASENFSIKTTNTLLVIERRHSIAEEDTIFLNLANTKVQQYRFQFTADQLNQSGLTGFLEDAYLNTSNPISLNGSTLINFTIANIPGSYATDRFRIVFAPALVLPLSFTSIKAYQKNKDIAVEWEVENEINIRQYEIEKSNNGTQFTSLSVIAATGNGGHSASYQVTDTHPVEGYNYYRIKSVDLNGRTEYTNVVKVLMGKGKQEITIYPNPVIDDVISIQLNNMPAGKYAVKLLNNLGQKLLDKIIQHTEGSGTELINIDKSMPHGIYQLQILKPNNEMITNKLIH